MNVSFDCGTEVDGEFLVDEEHAVEPLFEVVEILFIRLCPLHFANCIEAR